MKTLLIKFHPRHHEGNAWHVADSGTGNDVTLCGLAHEGACEQEYLRANEPKDETKTAGLKFVTCEQCLSIVALCKSIT